MSIPDAVRLVGRCVDSERGTALVAPRSVGRNRVPPKGATGGLKDDEHGTILATIHEAPAWAGACKGVLREATGSDHAAPVRVYLGTITGRRYVSRDGGGESWKAFASPCRQPCP